MSHLKRLSAPKTWRIERKAEKYMATPNPGGQPREMSMSLLSIVRDTLGIVQTAKELRALIQAKKVFVDGNVVRDTHMSVGFFDVISFPHAEKAFRVLLDGSGRLSVVSVQGDEVNVKICKITGKRTVKGGKQQISLHDGRTLLTEDSLTVGDSVLFSVTEGKIKQVFPLQEGAYIYLMDGKSGGAHGVLKQLTEKEATYESAASKQEVRTLRSHIMAVGETKPGITL